MYWWLFVTYTSITIGGSEKIVQFIKAYCLGKVTELYEEIWWILEKRNLTIHVSSTRASIKILQKKLKEITGGYVSLWQI